MPHTGSHHLRRPVFEPCESRLCLSTVAFAAHDIACCSGLAANQVATADVDGDGDLDVLSAHWFYDNKIAWYENMDGQGSFGPQQVINTAPGTSSIATADVDGDGDLDVLSVSGYHDQEISWYENTDGQGSFASQQLITTEHSASTSVASADVDGDGDVDVLSVSLTVNRIAWYENTDGQGSFGPQQVITHQAVGPSSVTTEDVDGDGDQDVLAASLGVNEVAWYENTDGQGTFGPQRVITTQTDGTQSVTTADVDGDGDQDVLSASSSDGKVAWYENTDGQGNFGPQRVITTQADGAQSVTTADVDGDGDQDVLSASSFDDKVAWYENTDGQGSFGPQQVITTQAVRVHSVATGDIDGDGDQDVLSASFRDGKVAWYEQRILGDVNDDGVFSSTDLVLIFQAGEYEDAADRNSSFDDGDWNGDGAFNSSDLVLAFQAGHYVAVATPAASEIAAAVDWLFSHDQDLKKSRALVA